MRFQNSDGSSFIQIDKRVEHEYPIFNISAVIDGFSGRNTDVIFTGCNGFLDQLRAFDLKRQGAVTLEGTEQFRLSISTFDNAGHMRVDLRLCRYSYQPGPKTAIVTLEGGFVFDVEFANILFQQIHELLRDCS